MSDTNRTTLRYVEESTWGTTPASAMTELRVTGESLEYSIDKIVSDELRSDRQVTDLIPTTQSPSGDISWELSYGTFDDFLRSALQHGADWDGVGSGTTETITSGATASNLDFTLASAGNTITFGSSVTHGIVQGQWIELTGSTSDDGYHLVTDATGQVITVESITGDEVLDETDAATVKGGMIRNGTTEVSFTLEKEFTDLTNIFHYFTGMSVNTMSLAVSNGAIASGSFGFMGKTFGTDTATQGTGGPTAATTTDVMAAHSNVAALREGGTSLSGTFVSNVDISLTNNTREIQSIDTLGNADLGYGRCEVTGTLNAYFKDNTLYNKFVNSTATSLSFTMEDASGNAYIVTLPRVEYSTGTVVASGPNADVMVDLGIQAVRDPDTDCTIQIDRFPA